MPNELDTLCRSYRTLQAEQRQLALQVACYTRRTEHSLIMREQLAELTQRQQRLLAGQRSTVSAIHRHTASLPDERLRTIIELRYLGDMSWAQISELMGLELRWLMRLHRRALNIS